MRKIYFLLIAFLSIAFISCERYERNPEGDVKATAPELNIVQSNVWLYDSNEIFTDKFLIRINCTEARFSYENGVPAKVSNLRYIFEMDIADFSNPVTVSQGNSTYVDLYSATLRNNILKWYGSDDSSHYISFRVKTICNGFQDTLISNSLTIRVDHTKPVSDTSTTPTIPDMTIKIRKGAECTWTDIYVYAWGADEIFGGWPGLKLVEESGWYSIPVAGVRPINLILNNGSGGGGNQFDFITSPTEDACYEITNNLFTLTDCN